MTDQFWKWRCTGTRQDRLLGNIPGHATHSWLDGDEQTVAVFTKMANEGGAKATTLSCNSCWDIKEGRQGTIPLVNQCMRHRPWAQAGKPLGQSQKVLFHGTSDIHGGSRK